MGGTNETQILAAIVPGFLCLPPWHLICSLETLLWWQKSVCNEEELGGFHQLFSAESWQLLVLLPCCAEPRQSWNAASSWLCFVVLFFPAGTVLSSFSAVFCIILKICWSRGDSSKHHLPSTRFQYSCALCRKELKPTQKQTVKLFPNQNSWSQISGGRILSECYCQKAQEQLSGWDKVWGCILGMMHLN